jgi:APA family basic amino acid/polyamine antiporter
MSFDLFAKKDIATLHEEAAGQGGGEAHLARTLGPFDLLALGVGAIIGAGIFVLTGSAAARYAGPAITISFVIAGVACAFAGLCYAEFASLIPVAGSAYTYGYASLGEIIAWIIGWDLILEYAFGAATVAVGWSGYVTSFLQDIGVHLPPQITASPGTELVLWSGRWERLETVRPRLELAHVDPGQLTHAVGSFDLIAMVAILAITAVLIIGVRESANLNTIIVCVKLCIVLAFIAIVTGALAKAHWAPLAKNWHPYIPDNAGEFGKFGWSGVLRGSAVIFFAYIGFDAVSTAAQEARAPKRDMPIGILGSLIICTVLYVIVSGLLTGIVPYTALNVPDPVAVGIDAAGVTWGSYLVKAGAIFGLTSVMLVMLLGQSRVFFSMASDGLLWEWAGKIHKRFRTPYISSIAVGLFVAFFAALIPIDILGELVSIGTLLAFIIVSASVWLLRRRQPDMPRPFKTPWVPFVPIMGMLIPLAMMLALPAATWLRLGVWLALGMAVYFGYGLKHSKVQAARSAAKQ